MNETIYAIHINDRGTNERVFTSVALVKSEVRPLLKLLKVGKGLQVKVYDVCALKYVTNY